MTEALLRLRSHQPVKRLRRVLGLSIFLGGLGVSVQMLLDAAAASLLLRGLLAALPVQAVV